jgi:RNA polymerase sigma factor (sigma-70 family)
MATGQLGTVLRHIRSLVGTRPDQDLTDAQLLERFTHQQDQSAFTTLMQRHGSLVWSACRRALPNEHDAEDAFQATFLVLALKAASIKKTGSVATWLYGAAYRSALQIKRQAARRRAHEREAEPMRRRESPSTAAWQELQTVLDEEVARLPEKHRAPFVLCCLDGKSKAGAAAELGWKEGTVSGRLARARKQLQERLTRRGVGLSTILCALALSEKPASAAVPGALAAATAQAALRIAGGTSLKASGVSVRVAVAVEGAAKAVFLTKAKLITALLMVLGVA